MKQMKTQGASDAMQMAHYKLTIIIIIIIIIAISYVLLLYGGPFSRNSVPLGQRSV